jgi:hypothetical protein
MLILLEFGRPDGRLAVGPLGPPMRKWWQRAATTSTTATTRQARRAANGQHSAGAGSGGAIH